METDQSNGIRPDLHIILDEFMDRGEVDPWDLVEEFLERHSYKFAEIFQRVDPDGRGLVSEEQFAKAIKDIGMVMHDDDIPKLIDRTSDLNDGGFVRYVRMMERRAAKKYKHLKVK